MNNSEYEAVRKYNKLILNLSLPRTATQSFHLAAKLGGRSSVHFNEFEYIFNYQDEETRWNEFKKVLSGYEVVSDQPIHFFVENLMINYGSSTFVLVERDVDLWVQSTKKLWAGIVVHKINEQPPIELIKYVTKRDYSSFSQISDEVLREVHRKYHYDVEHLAKKHGIELIKASLDDGSYDALVRDLFGVPSPHEDWVRTAF